jgi:UTP--glucose-1-phosphate uridylyltransferase
MPVLDKPTIQYVVEEAIAAGIEDILIIMGVGSGQLSDTWINHMNSKRRLRLLERQTV